MAFALRVRSFTHVVPWMYIFAWVALSDHTRHGPPGVLALGSMYTRNKVKVSPSMGYTVSVSSSTSASDMCCNPFFILVFGRGRVVWG